MIYQGLQALIKKFGKNAEKLKGFMCYISIIKKKRINKKYNQHNNHVCCVYCLKLKQKTQRQKAKLKISAFYR